MSKEFAGRHTSSWPSSNHQIPRYAVAGRPDTQAAHDFFIFSWGRNGQNGICVRRTFLEEHSSVKSSNQRQNREKSSFRKSPRAFAEETNVKACGPDTKGLKIEKAARGLPAHLKQTAVVAFIRVSLRFGALPVR